MGRPKNAKEVLDEKCFVDMGENSVDYSELKFEAPRIPLKTDPGWSDYVLSHLLDEEKFEGNPTVDGLWRVAEIVLGSVTSFGPTVIQAANDQNGWCSTVVYEAIFENENGIYRYSASADANPKNTVEEFARHATAMAETRAAGRMLRRALGLRKVVTAEEMTAPSIEKKDEDGNPKFMQHTQFVMINTLARKFNIDAKNYIDRYTDYYHQTKYNEIGEVPYTVASEMIQHIQKYGQGKDKDSLKPIPDDIVGYKPDFESLWGAG